MIVSLLVSCLVLVAAWLLLQKRTASKWEESMRARGATAPIPYAPYRVPILGHLPYLFSLPDQDNVLKASEHILKQSGDKRYQMTVFGRQYLLTTDPKDVKHVVSTQFEKVYFKGDSPHEQYLEFLGNGIFNVNGELWQKHRKAAAGLFHVNSLKAFVPIFNDSAKRLFNKLSLVRTTEKAQREGIDMQDFFMRYTIEAFGEIGFGVRMGSIEQEENHFGKAFDIVQTHSEHRGRWGTMWKYKEMVLPNKLYQDSLVYINETVNNIIAERKKEPAETLRGRSDLVSQLLLAAAEEPAGAYTDEEMRDFVMNFLIAGRDTTAMLLTWTFYFLAKHPDVERRVLDEIREKLGDDEPTWTNVKSMLFTKQVLQETLRMYPPVPVDGYTAFQDDVLPSGVPVQKGTEVYYISYLMHRDADLYERPDEFDPDRWNTPLLDPFAYVAFHAEMAYEEAKIMLVNLLRQYHLDLHPGFEPSMKVALLLTSKNGMRMDIHDRA